MSLAFFNAAYQEVSTVGEENCRLIFRNNAYFLDGKNLVPFALRWNGAKFNKMCTEDYFKTNWISFQVSRKAGFENFPCGNIDKSLWNEFIQKEWVLFVANSFLVEIESA